MSPPDDDERRDLEALDRFIEDYANAWWDASLSQMAHVVVDGSKRISCVGGNAFRLEFSEVIQQIMDRTPTPPEERRKTVEHKRLLGPGRACVQLVLEGIERFPLRKRLFLVRDAAGDWRIDVGYEEAADAGDCLDPAMERDPPPLKDEAD